MKNQIVNIAGMPCEIFRSLDEIAKDNVTDKSSNGHNYATYYDMLFSKLRSSPIKLLEIGIDSGASIKTWQEYFQNAEIHGIDIRDGYEYLHDGRTYTHVVDQSSKADLFFFGEKYPNYFDIIICDGSHQCDDDILTFETLFPYLKSGGFYVWEDLLCAYDQRWAANANSYDRIRDMIGEISMNGKMSNDHICANKARERVKYDLSIFESTIEWLFFSAGTAIIKKI